MGVLYWAKCAFLSQHESLPSGLCAVGNHLEAGSITDKLIQCGHDLGEFGPQVPLFHPAV